MWARSQVQHNTASLQVEGFFFPLASTSEIRPKEQIKKDFHESFIDSLFFSSLFSPFPIANISSLLDSGGIFTLFSAKHYAKLLRVIFSDTLCSLPTCWLCDLFYCLKKRWVKFGRNGGQFTFEDPFTEIKVLTGADTLWALPQLSIGTHNIKAGHIGEQRQESGLVASLLLLFHALSPPTPLR